jgi:hypothetical protein
MGKPLDPISLRDEVERRIFGLPGWISCTFLWSTPCEDGHTKSTLRAIELQGRTVFQDTRTGGRAAAVQNYPRSVAKDLVRAMLESDFSEVHIQSEDQDFHARITRKGRILSSFSRRLQREAPAATHDRAKDQPLDRCDDPRLLQALGFAGPDGRLLPSMHGKYRQVNEFLRVLDAVLDEAGIGKSGVRSPKSGIPESRSPETPETANCAAPRAALRLVDVGCGRAYLSFAARAYLSSVLDAPPTLVGIDLRDDIIASCRATAERLELSPPDVEFIASDIAEYTPTATPDVVFSLHACDTATDLALARGVQWGARAIVSAPCCQHEIQKTLRPDGPSRALLRHGILRERLADLLADALRAQILRILGYRVRVVEFVEPEATGRNLLLRAVKGVRPGAAEAIADYLALRDEWKVSPPLEAFLAKELASYGIQPATTA